MGTQYKPGEVKIMKRMLMAIMAVAVAISFSAPAFAGDPAPKPEDKDKKGKKETHMIYADEGKKKEEKPKDTKPK